MGRGRPPKFITAKLVPSKPPHNTTHDATHDYVTIVSNCMASIEKIRKQRWREPTYMDGKHLGFLYTELRQAQPPKPDVIKEKLPGKTIAFIDKVRRFADRFNHRGLKIANARLEDVLKLIRTKIEWESRSAFAQWVSSALDPSQGAGKAHRFTAGKSKASPLPIVITNSEGQFSFDHC